MWLATISGWFSVVIDQQHAGMMLVRARCALDIANLWRDHHEELASMSEPTSDETRDYRWRLSVSREDFVKLAARLAEQITYANFKSAVYDRKDQANKTLPYSRIWQLLHDVQRAETHGSPVIAKPDDGISDDWEEWEAFVAKVDGKLAATKPAKQKQSRKRKAKNVPTDR